MLKNRRVLGKSKLKTPPGLIGSVGFFWCGSASHSASFTDPDEPGGVVPLTANGLLTSTCLKTVTMKLGQVTNSDTALTGWRWKFASIMPTAR
jgi:hypothetical protein